MAERMLRFVSVNADRPEKRSAPLRAQDFLEIYGPAVAAKAAEQAARCSQCGVPFCQSGCPLSNAIPDWLLLTAEGRLEEAYALAASTNPMPEVCGRICPQDRLCEGACVIEQSGHGAVTIGAIEAYLTDTAFAEGWAAPLASSLRQPQSVGIIGAGPAGMAAGEALAARGYSVTIHDRHDRVGGLLIYGIPNFKLDKAIVARREARLRDGGVRFQLNCDIGRDVSFADLRARHDAVLIATGAYRARSAGLINEKAKGVIAALDYLIAANRAGLGDELPPSAARLNASGKRVLVIGGGDTAMDCVRTAVRQGAASVTCLYRRDRANMPGSAREVSNAEEEGVAFEWLAAPKAVLGSARKATGVRAVRMRLVRADASGRQSVEEIPDSDFDLEGDLIIMALGFDAEDVRARFAAPDLAARSSGALRIDARLRTNLPGVYAAGDIARGASLVVWALKDGRDAAEAIHGDLQALAASARVAAE